MSKITTEHLSRSAYVYIRQSTADQLTHNHESRRRQYGLADRAKQLGWTAVEVSRRLTRIIARRWGALNRLGIEHIPAYSPEARGRSERMFGTLQDRLVKELAHAGIGDIETANRWIREVYLPEHNARFAKPAAVAEKAFVAADAAALRETLCSEEQRVVGRDNTVAYGGCCRRAARAPITSRQA